MSNAKKHPRFNVFLDPADSQETLSILDGDTKYKLGYVKRGSTAFKVPKDGCGVPSAARALLGPEGLLMR